MADIDSLRSLQQRIHKTIEYFDVWRAYWRLRHTLRRGDMKTIADVKRELGWDESR